MRVIAAVLVLCALAGCASTPRPANPTGDLGTINDWQARGRIAVSGAQGGGSGTFRWEQQEARSDVLIRGPVGIGSLRVQMNSERPNRLRLQLGDGRELQAEAAVAELESRLGAAVPTSKLRYWLLGLPAPGPHEWVERTERSSILEQDGWRIEFLEFTREAGASTPARVKATSGDARIRLIINDWQLGTTSKQQ